MPKQHILLVEDDNALLRGVTDLLEMAGYDVSQATDGVAALDMMDEMRYPPDLIVSDIGMPHMDGFQFLGTVRSRAKWLSIPFIFMSAKDEKEDIRTGKLRGADDYVTKPFEFRDLLISVQSALNRREQISAIQASEMETLRHQILKVLNHEFRTPLSYIVAYADLMANSPSFKHSAELRQYIDGIMEGSERLTKLIESFLVLAELESGMGARIFEARRALIDDLRSVVDTAIDLVRERAAARSITMRIVAEDKGPALMGDVAYLELAIRHLLDNAIKFSPKDKPSTVTISLLADEDMVAIAVCDEGQGIPASEQRHLFETFYQIDRDHNEQQGTGAGLAIARHVAHLHGGHIALESEQGKGSCFLLKLPIYRT
jgi:two-component system, sensor histidine kinase and response regulator